MAQLQRSSSRVVSVDALRGLIMIVMALDHVRDFFHVDALKFSPEDLARTTPALFFTRWVTHFCAPVFVFTAGLAIYFLTRRGRPTADVARFLGTRGLWLIFLELTAMQGIIFLLGPAPVVILEVIWVLGVAMIAMAGLIRVPIPVLAVGSVAVIALHNLADPIQAGGWWNILHRQGVVQVGTVKLMVGYPLIPWVAVMAAGYCFGPLFERGEAERRRWFTRLGLGLTAAFLVLRVANVYGDPGAWDGETLMSFLRVNKYPPSLAFLLMTLGPAIALLPWLERAPAFLLTYGRVPLFYFLAHFGLAHGLAKLAVWWQLGRTDWAWSLTNSMLQGGRPAEYGFSLAAVYGIWVGVVALMYPLCRWFEGLKRRRGAEWWWLSYL